MAKFAKGAKSATGKGSHFGAGSTKRASKVAQPVKKGSMKPSQKRLTDAKLHKR